MESKREAYLTRFKRNQMECEEAFGKTPVNVGTKLVKLMENEDLTFDEAYASLQFAYEKIKYKSNFLKMDSQG
ncbi:hypothetical protein [Listeria booriae]|uniref:hypothetical protein n=1 Tax=Listeria booriae TaxID=1552123 RepID=UPI001C895611|nr:hypothetical protein [Listeria booriae]